MRHAGVKKGNDKLKKAIESALAKMKQSGECSALRKKYNLGPLDASVLVESARTST